VYRSCNEAYWISVKDFKDPARRKSRRIDFDKGGMISTQQKFLSLQYPALHSCTESPDWKRGGSHARGLDVVSGSARL
jgi:hypothetical protein